MMTLHHDNHVHVYMHHPHTNTQTPQLPEMTLISFISTPTQTHSSDSTVRKKNRNRKLRTETLFIGVRGWQVIRCSAASDHKYVTNVSLCSQAFIRFGLLFRFPLWLCYIYSIIKTGLCISQAFQSRVDYVWGEGSSSSGGGGELRVKSWEGF